ncbi:MAG: hypothetical protein KJ052_12720 [Candidatus Hydrogenedentes bacterium]|nr:hypothetical protein [Candidatus Hydrogenedentota bacterium]
MGDICNMADIERFLRSDQGKAALDEISAMLKGHTIVDVSFSNEVHCIALTLHLEDGGSYLVYPPSLEVDVLRETFGEVLEQEYYKDYPERRSMEDGP